MIQNNNLYILEFIIKIINYFTSSQVYSSNSLKYLYIQTNPYSNQ